MSGRGRYSSSGPLKLVLPWRASRTRYASLSVTTPARKVSTCFHLAAVSRAALGDVLEEDDVGWVDGEFPDEVQGAVTAHFRAHRPAVEQNRYWSPRSAARSAWISPQPGTARSPKTTEGKRHRDARSYAAIWRVSARAK
jgi:hypothetical protein